MPALVQLTGSALRGFERAAREARGVVYKGVIEIAYRTQRLARENARRNFKHKPPMPGERVRTGLVPSITVVPIRAALSAKVGANTISAHFREYGGTIRPLHHKFLSWWTTDPLQGGAKSWSGKSKKSVQANVGGASRRVFAKQVTQIGRPFLGPAFQQAQRDHPEIPVFGTWIQELYREPGA